MVNVQPTLYVIDAAFIQSFFRCVIFCLNMGIKEGTYQMVVPRERARSLKD